MFYNTRQVCIVVFLIVGVITLGGTTMGSPVHSSVTSPSFLVEPPSYVDFYNGSGTTVPCSAKGFPQPNVTWSRQDSTEPVTEISNLRYVRGDGALVLPPFASQDFRQEIHDAVYHCLLSNSAGTIASREVRVRGVVRRPYEVRTFDEFAVRGNTAVLRCEVPTGVKEYVKVVSWETNDGRTYSGPSEGKYSVTSEGILLIRNVDFIDSRTKYRCMTRDKLYGNSITSATWGELIVTEAIRSLPSKIRTASRKVRCPSGHTAELVCVAQGHPQPSTIWFRRSGKRLNPLAYSQRYHRQPGGLLIKKATIYDTGSYICLVNNSVGEDRVQIELLVTESLSVTVTPENILVTEGMTVTFYCNITGYPINNVVWKKNFQSVGTSTRMTMLSQEVLEISSVQRGDNGMYQCFVYGGDSTSAQGVARLALKEEAPIFNEVFPERVLRIGSSTSLKCVVDGNPLPQIEWKLYGRPVVESATLRIGDFVDVSGSLQSFVNISSVSVDQGGSYSCTAKNDFGSASHYARVHVVGAPYVHPMANISVISGGSAVLTCAAAGYPIEHFVWKKGQHDLPRSQRIIDHRNGSVTLVQAVKEDEGWYRCEVKSGRGERAHGNLYLKVIEKPVINPFLFGGDLREEMRTTVVCSVLTGERGLTIEWLKNGRPLKLIHPEAQVASIGDFTSSLTLNGVQRRHSGNYTCKVTSGSVTSEYSARMNVNASPKWVKKPSDVAVIRGDRVVLDCKAEGEPEPVHRWKHMQGSKNGAVSSEFRSVVSSPHMHVLENGSLVITEVEKSDSGAYLCDVNNGIAPALSAVVEVSVKVPPFFKKSFEVLTVNMSSNAAMVCWASGDLPITITWAKNRRPIDYNNSPRFVLQEFPVSDGLRSELLINQVNKMDSALFTCDASNEFGREERSVHFVVEAPPDSPSNLRVTQLSSSTATVTWTQTQSGNSPVSGYIVHFGPVSENWESGSSSIRATEAQVVLTGLKPGNSYKVKIISANAIGTSDPSEELTFTTEEAAPSKPPSQVTAIATSSKSLKITWKPIDQSTESSQILGYYVGYKETDTSGSHVFKTIDNVNGQTGEVELTNLSKSTKYSVSVQAFNKKGAGPMSEEIVVQTLEFDPPSAPKIALIRKSSNSVEIEWSYRENDNPITGYLLNYKASSNGDWQEIRLPSSNTRHYLEGLLCGTQYFVTLTAYNKAGKGTPSEPFSVKTTGSIPVPPKQDELLVVNSSAASLRLTAWNDGGCPIGFYVIQYKPRRHADWILLSNRILPGDGIATVSDLAAGSWYDLLMTAHNEAGANEGEYAFATLTLTGATVAPESKGSKGLGNPNEDGSAFQDPAVIVPIICAAVVVLVIVIVVTVVMVLRRKDNASECQSQDSASSVGKAENMSMVSYGKIKRGDLTEEHQRESLYYPTPYATTQIAGENEGHHHHHAGGIGPPQGTLRRVGRMAREHEYDIPQRLVQSGDYTPYAKLWTHTRNTSGDSNYGVGNKSGQPLSYLRTARSPHPLIKSCTQLGNEGDHLTSSVKDFSESGEFSETECDRDHRDLSLREYQFRRLGDPALRRLQQVC